MSEKVSLKDLAAAEKALIGTGDYVVPAISVNLPSKGKVYPQDSVMFGVDTLDIKSMTTAEENILSSRALIKKGTVLSTLMKACITNKLVDPDQLLVGDRNALLVAIRVSAYGAEYNTEIVCPVCDEKFEHAFDMSKLNLKLLEVDPPLGTGQNAFKFQLPTMNKEVIFKLLTGADIHEIDATEEKLKKHKGVGAIEEGVTLRLQAQILSIGGEQDRTKISRLVRDMPARDSRALRDYIDDIAPGVDMVQNVTCKACSEESEVDVPLGTEFFWPSRKRR